MSGYESGFLAVEQYLLEMLTLQRTKASGNTVDDPFFPDDVINDFTGCDNGFFGLFIKLTLGTVPSYSDDLFEC